MAPAPTPHPVRRRQTARGPSTAAGTSHGPTDPPAGQARVLPSRLNRAAPPRSRVGPRLSSLQAREGRTAGHRTASPLALICPAALTVAALRARAPAGRKRPQSPWQPPAGGCCRGVPPRGWRASPPPPPPGQPCPAVRTARTPYLLPARRPPPARGRGAAARGLLLPLRAPRGVCPESGGGWGYPR